MKWIKENVHNIFTKIDRSKEIIINSRDEGKSTKIALPHDFPTALDLVCYQMCAEMPDAAWSGPAGVKLAFRKAHHSLSVNSKANIFFL